MQAQARRGWTLAGDTGIKIIEEQPPGAQQIKTKKNGEAKGGGANGSVPVLPPKIDRQKKPQRKSAAERLFGRGDRGDRGDKERSERNSAAAVETPAVVMNGEVSDNSPIGGYTSLPGEVSTTPKTAYDSNSSSNYDSYNKHNEPGYSYTRTMSQPGQGGGGYSGPASGKYSQAQTNGQGQDRYRYR